MKLAILSLLAASAMAATLLKSTDIAVEGDYIVKMKETKNAADSCAKMATKYSARSTYRIGKSFKGFHARLTADELAEVLASDDVDMVSPNVRTYVSGIIDGKVFTTPNVTARAPVSSRACPDSQSGQDTVDLSWGQARVSSPTLDTYVHDATWGEGVDIYVTDTGSLCAHEEFAGRDCTCGPDFSGFIGAPDPTGGCADGNGHETFCSSIAAGNVFGIAKSAHVIGVKCMGDSGAGSLNGIVDSFNYAAEAAELSGRPSVVSVSLGTQGTNVLVDAAANAMAEVAMPAIAAGNSGQSVARLANTCTGSSPGAAEKPITVGSMDINDDRSYFSNYGPCLDVFAPGSAITGAYSGRNLPTDQYITSSGTSMATPHVAGLMAAILSVEGNMLPADLKATVIGNTTAGALDLICAEANGDAGTEQCEESPNLLLHTNYCA
jgi:cerevisin